MIAKQSGKNCVARGLSTMRLALGYNEPLPENLNWDVGPKAPYQILESAKVWFPEHNTKVYCSCNQAQKASNFDCFCGEYCDMTEQEIDNNIIAFSYYTSDDTISHFVVGFPTLYDGMYCSVMVCVNQIDRIANG